MRLQKWPGLLTYVSPYSVPPGGAVSQVNLSCSVAGQLTIRDGMRPVQFASESPANCIDVAGYSFGGAAKALAFTEDGQLHVLDNPAYGPELGAPFVPDLPYTGSQVNVGYDYRYNEGGDVIPDGDDTSYSGIYGGYPTTTRWPSCVQASCASGITVWQGGGAATTTWTATLHYGTELCVCP